MCVHVCAQLLTCQTLCDPMDCKPARLLCPWKSPGKNTGAGCHFLLQRFSWPRDQNHVSCVSCIGRQILYHCATWEAPIEVFKYQFAQSCPTLCNPMDYDSSLELSIAYGCESWTVKNWCVWTVALEKTLEGPLDCQEITPVSPKVNQPWIFTGRTDAEAEALIRWPPDVKSWLIGKDPDAGKDWRQKEKRVTEDEMVK